MDARFIVASPADVLVDGVGAVDEKRSTSASVSLLRRRRARPSRAHAPEPLRSPVAARHSFPARKPCGRMDPWNGDDAGKARGHRTQTGRTIATPAPSSASEAEPGARLSCSSARAVAASTSRPGWRSWRAPPDPRADGDGLPRRGAGPFGYYVVRERNAHAWSRAWVQAAAGPYYDHDSGYRSSAESSA